jgi:hypothetical protein
MSWLHNIDPYVGKRAGKISVRVEYRNDGRNAYVCYAWEMAFNVGLDVSFDNI